MSEGIELMEVVCEKGALTFDGRVVELFGFGRQEFSMAAAPNPERGS